MSLSIQWAKREWDWDDQTLRFIEDKLADVLDENGRGFSTTEAKNILIDLEAPWSKIVKEREET